VDPAVDFGLQFHVSDAEGEPEPHEEAENDHPVDANKTDDGDDSNVVTVDFGRKK
jgi:hypothetical protein